MRLRGRKKYQSSIIASRGGNAGSRDDKHLPRFEVKAELSLATQDLRCTLANSQRVIAPLSRSFHRPVDPFMDSTIGSPFVHPPSMTQNSRVLSAISKNRHNSLPGGTDKVSFTEDAAVNNLIELVAPYNSRNCVPLTVERLCTYGFVNGKTISAGACVPLEQFSTASLCSSGPPRWQSESKDSSAPPAKKSRSLSAPCSKHLRILVNRWNDQVIPPRCRAGKTDDEDPEALHERVMLSIHKEEEAVKLMVELEQHSFVRDRARIRATRREEDIKSVAASTTTSGRFRTLPNSWSVTSAPAVVSPPPILGPIPGKTEVLIVEHSSDDGAAKALRELLHSTAAHCGGAKKGFIGARRRITFLSDGTVSSFCSEKKSMHNDAIESWAEYVLCEGDFSQLYHATWRLAAYFSASHMHSDAFKKFAKHLQGQICEKKNNLNLNELPQAIAVLAALPFRLLPLQLKFARKFTSSAPSSTVSVDTIELAMTNESSSFTPRHSTATSFDMDLTRLLQLASSKGVLTGNLPRSGEVLIGVEIDVNAIARQSQCRAVAMKAAANIDALAAQHHILVRAAFEFFGHSAAFLTLSVPPLRSPNAFAPLPAYRDHYTVDVWQLYITAAAALRESHNTLLPRLSLLRTQYPGAIGRLYAARGESAIFSATKALWDLESAYSVGLAELHRNECAVLLYAEHVDPYAAFLRADTALWGPVYLRSLRVAYAFCAAVAQLGTDAIPPLYRPLLPPVLHFVECLGGQRELRQRVEEFLLELEERGKRVRLPLVRWDVPRLHRAELDAAAEAVAENKCSAEDVIACLAAPSDVLATPPLPLASLKVRYIDVPPLSALMEGK